MRSSGALGSPPDVASIPLDWPRLRTCVRAVAFDLDGTLLDTLPDLADAGNAMLVELGRPTVSEAVVRSFIGDGVARLVARLLVGSRDGEPPSALFERALRLFERHYRDGLDRRTRVYPGVVEGLAVFAAAGLKLACVTNKPEAFTRPLLASHGLDHCLDLVLGGDTLPRKKPDPLPLRHCASVFGIDTHALLMVGDSANDVLAARAAGCPVVCVAYGYTGDSHVRSLGADAIVENVLDAAVRLLPPSS
jgi:phosphoglycolate phosphatase